MDKFFNSFQHFPLGQRIPDSPHAVSLSLPTLKDVVSYEEKEPHAMAKILSGYPRFVQHAWITRLSEHLQDHLSLGREVSLFCFANAYGAEAAARDLELPNPYQTLEWQGIGILTLPKDSRQITDVKNYIQHTGCGLLSRQAEDLLLKLDLIDSRPTEEPRSTVDEGYFNQQLSEWFSPGCTHSIIPTNSGMNAFYAAFRAAKELQQDRSHWISVGWLYMDTTHILNKYIGRSGTHKHFHDGSSTEAICSYIKNNPVAAVVIEAPANPLVHTPDLKAIQTACREAQTILILDPSLVSPQNMDLCPWGDVVTCSLTKYSGYRGDVMMGALCINSESPFGDPLAELLPQYISKPYARDIAYLSATLPTAYSILEKLNENTPVVADFLQNHPAVESIHWAYQEGHAEFYKQFERNPGAVGSVITVKFKEPLHVFYDRVKLPKGPSFGTVFSLVCPYLYLAHYDLIRTEQGRQYMHNAGVHPEMVRLSIGTEPVDEIIQVLEEALS